MGFRITAERIAALKAKVYERYEARTNPTPAPVEEISPEQAKLLKAAKLAKTHFQAGHAKGIVHVCAALLGVHLAADGIEKLLTDPPPYQAGDVLMFNDKAYAMGLYPGNGVSTGLCVDGANFEAHVCSPPHSVVFATREQIDAMFVEFEAHIAPAEPADKFIDHVAKV